MERYKELFTTKEQKWFNELKAVMKKCPNTLWIFCTPNSFDVYHANRHYDPEKRKTKDSCIDSINYSGDCGAY